ncbi:2-polyprenyl-3-methyl-6-methoxy-1,4-benzoquinone monooxygenase [Pseudomarimonas salicorniae]|uniref:3-demethoxyubiquinol 3-hydroxylase n=1 Tax=Pseudomarimonas salicorniae TaxID=2933270 RepID=A0ABT0GJ21_9GAMM|nr:2-polyprenyl-3-methyl-6-methoxy-1,4-benzoquinone monooxygenase [Lysobacter sp. CAU 1642]MCK7594532.1 2-polyprenyl-3-methyl-6-methoxy-1,4-benzoquinone monooxygenase [Lysobacter sp. CAU 1642]
MTLRRTLSPLDRALSAIESGLVTSLAEAPEAARPSPGDAHPPADLDRPARRHVAGLMRINHAGEVCAQALYRGQAAVARDAATRETLLQAAAEEGDHLAWCAARLRELDSRPSRLNPVWYAGSYALGVAAGLYGDGYNLGFVVETERQVEAHLGEHLERLPAEDARSRAILSQMQADEAEHGEHARAAGAKLLPEPIPRLMQWTSRIMKTLAYRL